MSVSEKARHYAEVAKDATVGYVSEFADDPLGHSADLAVGAAYFAGDLAVPGGLDAPTRFIRGESTFAQAVADQSVSAGVEMTAGFAMGKVFRVGKRLGSALVKGEKTLAKAVVEKIAERKVGQVGTYRELTRGAPNGCWADGMEAHHIPSDAFMKKYGLHKNDGLSVVMTKRQHKLTRTHLNKGKITAANPKATPRSELAADLLDVRAILRQDGAYTPQINRDLISGVASFRQKFPEAFRKIEKKK